ncbi:hypothetical protein [Polyangium aurulentum]|uniref:hypothetical protein n=1 Tax=Polyangium aurulentum TaxID=2567896 RepID=UPI0010AEB894|nr:hypothetical protein [Polyangium aurulentum]UQA59403.1 hypothetical protein E8A73_002515 [Polyangium aurulentum]
MSLIVIAVTAAVAASIGYLASRRRTPLEGVEAPEKLTGGKEKEAPKALKPARDPLAGLTLALGDVVSAEGEERWLAGALVVRDRGETMAAVMMAPEGLTLQAVVAFPPPERRILWLSPVEVVSPPEPPATLEIAGAAMTRKSRLPVAFERLGQGAPGVGATGIFATYETGGREVAVVITSEGKTFAWVGRRLEVDEYDNMGRAGEND